MAGWSRSRSVTASRLSEDGGRRTGQVAAHAVDEGDLGVLDLARAAVPPELADRLDQQEDPEHAGVGVGEPAATGVEREVAADGGALAGDEPAALTLGAEAEVLELDEGGVGEGVVELRDVDVGRCQPGL